MQPEGHDAAHLWDMLQAARRAAGYVAKCDYAAYTANRMMQDAVERTVGIIGEAARRVSVSCKTAHPEIPWTAVIANRHILVHEYGDVDPAIMWRIVTVHIPDLIPMLERITPQAPVLSLDFGLETSATVAAQAIIALCPGQGAQAVGMGKVWYDASPAARAVFDEADAVLGDSLGLPLTTLCFQGSEDRLNRTDVSQPAIYTCSVACHHGLIERGRLGPVTAAAGLSLGEYTALHLAAVFNFADGLRLVATRGKLMQQAAQASPGGMVALIGTEEAQAQHVCEQAAQGEVLVCANFNAPGQIVLSGHATACDRAAAVAGGLGLRASKLTVAGAFHSPLMQPAADAMADALAAVSLHQPRIPVWSNVTARPHDGQDMELLRRRLVEQIVSPVRWSHSCTGLIAAQTAAVQSPPGHADAASTPAYHELAPGTVLKGLMRRIDRNTKVVSHDDPND
jgi:[acyl-carrier-protein] S-malonyltransferase